MKITSIDAYEILASGGYPTIETKVTLDTGTIGVASVPYGASAGSHEATVLTDNDPEKFAGQGMQHAITNIKDIITPGIIDMNPEDQRAIDQKMIELDGTPNKAKLGGNAILAVSLAIAHAVANEKKIPLYKYIIQTYNLDTDLKKLPHPMVVAIEGGKHADDTTDLQEFCITGIAKASIVQNVENVMETYHTLKKILKAENLSTNVGNEGAFAPNGIKSNEAPFEYITNAIKESGFTPGTELGISVDAAASEYFVDGKYNLKLDGKVLSSEEVLAYYEEWFKKYPIVTFEDPLNEDDWENWPKALEIWKKYNIQLVGDDLTVTNMERLQKAIDTKSINSILIKLNQIGSLTETVDCCMLAKRNGLTTITSHRGGGETNDTSMVDLAVAVGSDFIKVGPTRGERVAKYNRLMEIEREITPPSSAHLPLV